MLASSCTALDALNATPLPIIPTETPLPTSTIVWFPPSATPTLGVFATNPPTPEKRPGLSTTFLTDDFSDPSLWDIASSDQASAKVESNRITLAVQSQVYMASLRRELFIDNYYAEITARPSLCRGEDSYGLHIRANGGTYYRYALSCNGTTYLDRLSNGTKLTLQKPIPSGDVPPGAPGEVRIGVWAVGKDIRLFLNGRYQFSIIDPSFPIGTIGVFVNSSGNTATVVSFSDLVIKEVDYIPPTSTPIP
ncbi:MAG: hypothetical protein H7Y59_00940 [Anaerolineales bacterium]|nr:hypothetical protein [Anaerolineales bacterium]